jgi:hypothetical protein
MGTVKLEVEKEAAISVVGRSVDRREVEVICGMPFNHRVAAPLVPLTRPFSSLLSYLAYPTAP